MSVSNLGAPNLRTCKTANGLISLMREMGFENVTVPMKAGESASHQLRSMTVNLPDDAHVRLCALADAGGVKVEELARQVLAIGVGVNMSSKTAPYSSVLLQIQSDDLLGLEETEPIFVRDVDHGDFVIVAGEQYEHDGPPSDRPGTDN